jgi:hypothetical protein
MSKEESPPHLSKIARIVNKLTSQWTPFQFTELNPIKSESVEITVPFVWNCDQCLLKRYLKGDVEICQNIQNPHQSPSQRRTCLDSFFRNCRLPALTGIQPNDSLNISVAVQPGLPIHSHFLSTLGSILHP